MEGKYSEARGHRKRDYVMEFQPVIAPGMQYLHDGFYYLSQQLISIWPFPMVSSPSATTTL